MVGEHWDVAEGVVVAVKPEGMDLNGKALGMGVSKPYLHIANDQQKDRGVVELIVLLFGH